MDHYWLNQLDPSTAVLVPTRSLANALNEQFAQYNIAQGLMVWEAPTILVWSDYLRVLWQANRDMLSMRFNANTLISSQQSLLLWTQVIEASRREERDLTLLNVQQTARAVQRSWRLMSDWRVSAQNISQDHVADTAQFLLWLEAYQIQLQKRSVIDEAGLLGVLRGNKETRFVHKRVIWYAYDLITASQHALDTKAMQAGVTIEPRYPHNEETEFDYVVYPDAKSELRETFKRARQLLEKNSDAKINIVVPDLQYRQTEAREQARQVFYPAASPIQVQQNNTAYRFSLGQPLNEWAAIETALSVVAVLKNRSTVSDLSFLLRNQFLRLNRQFKEPCRAFDRWLKSQRMRHLLFDNLPLLHFKYIESTDRNQSAAASARHQLDLEFNQRLVDLVAQRQALQAKLNQVDSADEPQSRSFSTLSFAEWVGVFNEWLAAWGWQTATIESELNTVQHQLQQRWLSLLEEIAALSTVQRQAGLKRAIEILEQMARDAIFLPKAVASPIVISSVFEAIGRPVDMCYLTGMSQDYPAAPRPDAFVPNRLLVNSGHPDVTAEASFQQAKKVNLSLLACAKKALISYAQYNTQDTEITQQSSAIYRDSLFPQAVLESTDAPRVDLQDYLDTQGPAWSDASRARGGSKIFENQSNCEFKAFVTHQLGFQRDDEAEFGLDGLDRGNVIHHLLDLVWGELQTQQCLVSKSEADLEAVIGWAITSCIEDESLRLSVEKRLLLQHERPRLLLLMKNWLALEARRPEHFTVIEREEPRVGQFAGIEFKYIVDRLDMTDDGRSFIIDYKTGLANRKDWMGERIKRPQMPLYAVALDAIKSKPVSGIAYAKVNQSKHEFVELSEAEVFRKGKGYESAWLENRADWDAVFNSLANDFLLGKASVNPIDEETCRYCDLQSVCRVSQLRSDSIDVQMNRSGLNVDEGRHDD